MTGFVNKGDTLAQALESNACRLVSSDGAQGTLSHKMLQAHLEHNGLQVSAAENQAALSSNFNGQVCAVGQNAPAVQAPTVQPTVQPTAPGMTV